MDGRRAGQKWGSVGDGVNNYLSGMILFFGYYIYFTDEQLRRRCQLKALHSLFNLHMDLRCLLANIIRMELLLLCQ